VKRGFGVWETRETPKTPERKTLVDRVRRAGHTQVGIHPRGDILDRCVLMITERAGTINADQRARSPRHRSRAGGVVSRLGPSRSPANPGQSKLTRSRRRTEKSQRRKSEDYQVCNLDLVEERLDESRRSQAKPAPHSLRRATKESSLAARRAGSHEASSAQTISTPGARVKTTGSVGLT